MLEENFIYNTQGSGCKPAAKLLSQEEGRRGGGFMRGNWSFLSSATRKKKFHLSPSKSPSLNLIFFSADSLRLRWLLPGLIIISDLPTSADGAPINTGPQSCGRVHYFTTIKVKLGLLVVTRTLGELNHLSLRTSEFFFFFFFIESLLTPALKKKKLFFSSLRFLIFFPLRKKVSRENISPLPSPPGELFLQSTF